MNVQISQSENENKSQNPLLFAPKEKKNPDGGVTCYIRRADEPKRQAADIIFKTRGHTKAIRRIHCLVNSRNMWNAQITKAIIKPVL